MEIFHSISIEHIFLHGFIEFLWGFLALVNINEEISGTISDFIIFSIPLPFTPQTALLNIGGYHIITFLPIWEKKKRNAIVLKTSWWLQQFYLEWNTDLSHGYVESGYK